MTDKLQRLRKRKLLTWWFTVLHPGNEFAKKRLVQIEALCAERARRQAAQVSHSLLDVAQLDRAPAS